MLNKQGIDRGRLDIRDLNRARQAVPRAGVDLGEALQARDAGDFSHEPKDRLLKARIDEIVPASGGSAQSASQTPASGESRLFPDLAEADGATRLVFHEAKHFTNPELRASPGRQPPIVEQVERCRGSLAHHAEAIGAGYARICRNLLRIDEMRRTVLPDAMPVHRSVRKVAEDAVPPVVDPEPRLIVFGFDRDQRDGPTWQAHQRRLTAAPPDGFGLRVRAVGGTSTRLSA